MGPMRRPILNELSARLTVLNTLGTSKTQEEQAREWLAEVKVLKRTRKTYDSAWKKFENWCTGRGYEAFPASPATVVLFLKSSFPDFPTA